MPTSWTAEGTRRRLRRWMYRGGRPRGVARLLNRLDALVLGSGRLPVDRAVTLEVAGRRTGRVVPVPVVVADLDGERYLISMLGAGSNWVRNVRAARGAAVLRRGTRTAVRLEEVPVAERAPIIKRYLDLAPGARAHIPVDRREPVAAFEAVAADHPVFRVRPLEPAASDRQRTG
ncbi:nitroreductase/quinone reductase family protein [Blastococcus sp. TF02A-30]|uniref:nitroreductase/quinone reductase family protein n=1 Tax=Blastococcus sp. TF02A-30 TaxID=2250580 RepID=UPI0018F4C241|nr:nitroreductase/quinone reductase family protein [Blastococcus sp. TF02A-30]